MNDLTKVRKSVMEETQVLPEMAGQSGKVLSNNGSMPRWIVGRYVGELIRVSMDIAPPGCFALDGSRIVNGKNDFAALANCGSRFITISGNDLILSDCPDFGRGKGSSGRSVGSFEGDALLDHCHYSGVTINIVGVNMGVYGLTTLDVPGSAKAHATESSGSMTHQVVTSRAKNTVISTENRPKSLTELVCIYHGVL